MAKHKNPHGHTDKQHKEHIRRNLGRKFLLTPGRIIKETLKKKRKNR